MPLVSEFLCERLGNAGVGHIFGVNGIYVNGFLDVVKQSGRINFVENVDENHAGFSADAYARAKGIGCVCATYNTGALKLCNAVAGAYAERSPVVVISGSPGIKERNNDFLSNHLVESFSSQKEIFDHITSYSVVLDDPTTAGWKIDNALNILKESKQPVYIEVPRDVASQPIKYDVYTQGTPNNHKSDALSLKESVEDVSLLVRGSTNPVLVVGVQIARFGLEELLIKFAEKHNIPIVTTFLSKSSIKEDHPLFSGVYYGKQTLDPKVSSLVESSDCLLIFGEMLTDTAFGFITPSFNTSNTVFCSIENLRVKNHVYHGVRFVDFCKDFFKTDLGKKNFVHSPKPVKIKFQPQKECLLKIKRFFEKIDSLLDNSFAVLIDLDNDLLESAELTVPHHGFISSAFYCSMGLALPGSIGLKLARPEVRPLVIISERSFQTSHAEISTILCNGLDPIIFVLSKGPSSLKSWSYDKVCDMIKGGFGFVVDNEQSLEESIDSCIKKKGLSVVSVNVATNSK